MNYAHTMRFYCILAYLFLGLIPSAKAEIEYPKSDSCAEIDAALAADISDAWRERLIDRAKACRLPVDDLTPAGALTILAGKPFAVQRQDDAITMVARGFAAPPQTCCTVQRTMESLGDDLWIMRYRLARLDEGMLFLFAYDPQSLPEIEEADIVKWRGPAAPLKPEFAAPLRGEITFHEIWSEALQETRRFEVYLPAVADLESTKIIFVADGLGAYPNIAESLVDNGDAAPVAIIGLPAGQMGIVEDKSGLEFDIRNADYLDGSIEGNERFLGFQRFVFDELMPHLATQFRLSTHRENVIVAGQSSGAEWALSSAIQRSEKVSAAIVMSAGRAGLTAPPASTENFAVYRMSAGLYELDFYQSTRRSSEILKAAGYDATFTAYAAGHAQDQWYVAFKKALQSLAPANADQ